VTVAVNAKSRRQESSPCFGLLAASRILVHHSRSSRTAARQPGSARRRAISDARSHVFELLAHRAWNPPPSSSLAEEERLRSLLLRAAARDFPTLAAI
jgi:hypothetical protein